MSQLLLVAGWSALGAGLGGLIQLLYPWLRRIEELEDETPWPGLDLLVPVAVAALFGLVALKGGWRAELGFQSFLVLVLVQVAAFDLSHRLILDRVLLPASAVALVWTGLQPGAACAHSGCFGGHLLAALLGLVLYVAMLLGGRLAMGRDALGWGDVKLAGFIGAGLGFEGGLATIWALLLGMMLGGLIGLALVLLRLRSLSDYIPYGPFMCGGAVLAIFLYLGPNPLVHSG